LTAAAAVGFWTLSLTRQRSAGYPVGDDDDALSSANIYSVHPSTMAAAAVAAAIELTVANAAAVDVDDAARTMEVAATCVAACLSDDGSRPHPDLDYCWLESSSAPT